MADREEPAGHADPAAAAAASKESLGLDETIAQLVVAPLEQPAAAVMASITDQHGSNKGQGRSV